MISFRYISIIFFLVFAFVVYNSVLLSAVTPMTQKTTKKTTTSAGWSGTVRGLFEREASGDLSGTEEDLAAKGWERTKSLVHEGSSRYSGPGVSPAAAIVDEADGAVRPFSKQSVQVPRGATKDFVAGVLADADGNGKGATEGAVGGSPSGGGDGGAGKKKTKKDKKKDKEQGKDENKVQEKEQGKEQKGGGYGGYGDRPMHLVQPGLQPATDQFGPDNPSFGFFDWDHAVLSPYLNQRDPESGAWLGGNASITEQALRFESLLTLRKSLHPSLAEDFGPWFKSGGYDARSLDIMIEDMKSDQRANVVVMAIIDSRPYYKFQFEGGFSANRVRRLHDVVGTALRYCAPVPDQIVLLSLPSDAPSHCELDHVREVFGDAGKAAPIVAWGRKADHANVIAMPNLFFGTLDEWRHLHAAMKQSRDQNPYDERRDIAMWRGDIGDPTPKGSHNTSGAEARLKLILFREPEDLELGVLEVHDSQWNSSVEKWDRKGLLPGGQADVAYLTGLNTGLLHGDEAALPPQHFSKYKYIISMPGSAQGSYSRHMQFATAAGGVVLLWEQAYWEFYYRSMVEGEHLFHVNEHTILPTIRRLRENPDLARRIAANVRRFFDEDLAPDALIAVWRQFFTTNAALSLVRPTSPLVLGKGACQCDEGGPLPVCGSSNDVRTLKGCGSVDVNPTGWGQVSGIAQKIAAQEEEQENAKGEKEGLSPLLLTLVASPSAYPDAFSRMFVSQRDDDYRAFVQVPRFEECLPYLADKHEATQVAMPRLMQALAAGHYDPVMKRYSFPKGLERCEALLHLPRTSLAVAALQANVGELPDEYQTQLDLWRLVAVSAAQQGGKLRVVALVRTNVVKAALTRLWGVDAVPTAAVRVPVADFIEAVRAELAAAQLTMRILDAFAESVTAGDDEARLWNAHKFPFVASVEDFQRDPGEAMAQLTAHTGIQWATPGTFERSVADLLGPSFTADAMGDLSTLVSNLDDLDAAVEGAPCLVEMLRSTGPDDFSTTLRTCNLPENV